MNQNPEQKARDTIDKQLRACGWVIQDKNKINLAAGCGVAIREYQTDVGPADYVLFVERKPVGIIEAKRPEEGRRLSVVETQSKDYATSKLKYLNNDPLAFAYESTGEITKFTDYRDPKPRSRGIFTFPKPETLREMLKKEQPLRERLQNLPELPESGLRDCQIRAINNLDKSLKDNKPKALIQMATGSGKTFTAITAIYRLLKFADAKRILFLVDTKNLGEQAEQEFAAYIPNDDNRKFTELYNVQRLRSNYVASDSQVCISTIQRFYSILKGEELDESAEQTNPAEIVWEQREPLPVIYNEKVPPEFFDFVVIDECHRSIYNLWKQVLDYFDSFMIGLTATPDKRTFGFFSQNVVSEYTHEQAIIDKVNVGYDVFVIETEISKKGGAIAFGEFVDKRDKLTHKTRWEQLDEEISYKPTELDKAVVNPSTIRMIIRAFRDKLPVMFPQRDEVPKTLIFAKTDSHAEDIIAIVREEFGEGNEFCKKITYAADDPKSVLAQFRNDYNPRIAVTVDMIATGTDVKPLECLLFLRDVKSKGYFEQMKGRGTRTISLDDLRKVTPSARYTKDHFVIVDAVGVTRSLKTDSRPLERKPAASLKDLLGAVAVGARDEDLFMSLANRLIRLEKQLNDSEREKFAQITAGKTLNSAAKGLLDAYDPDKIAQAVRDKYQYADNYELPEPKLLEMQREMADKAAVIFTGEVNEYLDNARRAHEQIIDGVNIDEVTCAEWDAETQDKAEQLAAGFAAYIAEHKNEILALQIFYSYERRRRELTYKMIQDLYEKLTSDCPEFKALRLWQAYEGLDKVSYDDPKNRLIALVALVRRAIGIDQALTPYDKTVDKNFQNWAFQKQAGKLKFNEQQMEWLRMIKDHIAMSFHLEHEDLDLTPFDAKGGLGGMWQLFGDKTDGIIDELNDRLVA